MDRRNHAIFAIGASAAFLFTTHQCLAQERQPPEDGVHEADPPQVFQPARRERGRRFGFRGPGDVIADEAYGQGYDDGFEQGWLAAQRVGKQKQLQTLHQAALAQGRAHFKDRRYGAAARNLMLAARNDQGDPVSRLYAADAMITLGHYEDAFHLLRRAFELQPNLVYVALDIPGRYAAPAEFAERVERLQRDAQTRNDATVWTLLGYYRFHSNEHRLAHRALQEAAKLAPGDAFIRTLLDAARMSVPATTGAAEKKPKPQ